MIVDGRAIAEDLYHALEKRRATLENPLTLGILVAGHDPVIEQFVKIKGRASKRMQVKLLRVDLPEPSATTEAIAAVERLSKEADGIIVQLPLPKGIDLERVLSAIPKEKDVDSLNPTIGANERAVIAPVALAVREIIERYNVDMKNSKAVVVGEGRLVGAPTSALLQTLGAHVVTITLDKGSLAELKDADVIVSGAGNPGFITPDLIKEGAVLIDAGTSEQSGKVKGDFDPSCASKALAFTPVPGGVGPIAVAMIFKNLLDLFEASKT